MTGVSVITAPLFSSQSFPSEAEYPFDVQHQPLKTLIYAHHILTAYQSVIQVSANTFPALLLWFVAARFRILSTRFRTMTNMKELIKYTREHYILLRCIRLYIKENIGLKDNTGLIVTIRKYDTLICKNTIQGMD